MKISEILHRAADEFLGDGVEPRGLEAYSCCAVSEVLNAIPGLSRGKRQRLADRIWNGLEAMGCPTWSMCAYQDMWHAGAIPAEIQGARYLWLKWAALMAEEQGV